MNRSNFIPIVALVITAIALIPAFGQWLSPHAPVNSSLLSNDVEKPIAPPTSTPEPIPEVLTGENTSTPSSAINSAVRVVVEGFGIAPDTMTDSVRREQAAILAAEADAKRKLAEWIAGAQIEAVTVVSQGTVVTDVIRQIVQAKVPVPKTIRQEYDNATGHAYVTLELMVDEK